MPRLEGFSRAVMGLCISCLEDNYKAGKRVSGGSQRLHLFLHSLVFQWSFFKLWVSCYKMPVFLNVKKSSKGR